VKTYYKYYPMLGIPIPDDNALKERLKTAVSNSRKKKYHGNEDSMNELPKINVQALALVNESSNPFDFYDEEKKEFLAENDPKWEKATLSKFSWIQSLIKQAAAGTELKPY
jgi:hypothetical protein